MRDSTDPSTEAQRVNVTGEDGTPDATGEDGALDATGVYETASGVVLYDTEEPLAWVQADNAVRPTDMA